MAKRNHIEGGEVDNGFARKGAHLTGKGLDPDARLQHLPPGDDIGDQRHADTSAEMPMKEWNGEAYVVVKPKRPK